MERLLHDEAKEAIAMAAMVEQGQISVEDAKKESEAYRLAVARSNQEFTGGAGQFLVSTLGLSVTSVPKGENELRQLQDDYGRANEKYKKADKSLDEFLAKHPDMDPELAAETWEKANPKLAAEADALTKFFDAATTFTWM